MKRSSLWTVVTLLMAGCASTPRTTQSLSEATAPNRVPVSSAVIPARAAAAPRREFTTTAPVATAFMAGLPSEQANPQKMVAHFIDVGQGDATLLEFACGAMLIDSGGESTPEVSGRARLVDYLKQFYTRRADLAWTVDLVVLSHPHKDHTDGMHALLAEEFQPALTILNVLDNGRAAGSGRTGQIKLQTHAQETGAGYVGLSESDIPTVAGVTSTVIDPIDCSSDGGVDPLITALWGRVEPATSWSSNANNESIVLRVDFGESSFLFTGDLEEAGSHAMLESYVEDASVFDVDVLKVAHHGSADSTPAALVAATSPTTAVIQAGDMSLSHGQFTAYSFAHPRQVAVDRLLTLSGPNGLSSRPARNVMLGVKGANPSTGAAPRFVQKILDQSIYSNAWDGNVAIVAQSDGTLRVETEF